MKRDQRIEEAADIISSLFNPKLTKKIVYEQNEKGWSFETIDEETENHVTITNLILSESELKAAIKMAEKWRGTSLPEE